VAAAQGKLVNDASGRTWLFVPGSRPDRFDKAATSGADQVILDLEDAVLPSDKEDARAAVIAWLGSSPPVWVRVNAVGSAWHEDDVKSLVASPGLAGVVLPKAQDATELEVVGRAVGHRSGVIGLVETAVGVREAHSLAACSAVSRLTFGAIDFALDIDSEENDEALLLARSTLVLASRAAGKAPPIDGVTTQVAGSAVARDAARAHALGFGGKLCIHPAQLASVRAAFAPTAEQLEWAHHVLASAAPDQGAAKTSDGQMVDAPVLARARRLVASADPGSTKRESTGQ
jgi:citrate lyase subunit beta/citryl-CoA lyase